MLIINIWHFEDYVCVCTVRYCIHVYIHVLYNNYRLLYHQIFNRLNGLSYYTLCQYNISSYIVCVQTRYSEKSAGVPSSNRHTHTVGLGGLGVCVCVKIIISRCQGHIPWKLNIGSLAKPAAHSYIYYV